MRAVKHPHPLVLLVLLVSPLLFAQDAPLTIERAVQLAVERNERPAIADTAVAAAEARVRRGRTAFLPQVDITGNWSGGTDHTLSTSALLSQTLFDARIFPLYRQLKLERDAAKLSARGSRRILAFDAAEAFVITLSFEQILLAAEHRRSFAQQNLDDVRARFEAGLVSSNDVTRAELELATAVRGLAEGAGDVQSSRIDLETLLKAEVPGQLAPPDALLQAAAAPPALSAEQIAAAQNRRSDIGAARARLEGLRAFAEEPSKRFIPSVLFNAQTR